MPKSQINTKLMLELYREEINGLKYVYDVT